MFTYAIFLSHIVPSLAIFSLVMATISMWVYRRPVIWGSFIVIALALAYLGKLITPIGLLPLGILLLCHLILATNVSGILRLLIVLVATVISFALFFHIVPGFANWLIVKKMHLSPGALPYSLYLNVDKPFIGLFTLGLSLHLVDSLDDLRRLMKQSLPAIAIGIAILFFVSYSLHTIRFAFKVPLFTPIWLIANLFLTTIPEEVFFRGFLQREITDALKNKFGGVLAILAVSLAFAAAHLPFVDTYGYAISALVASAVYGTVYHLTSRIESAIVCHFLVNVIHLLFFTYPALVSSL